mgnify:CR=1 FL=1
MKTNAPHLVEPPKTILVVDDSAVARQALRALIERDPGFRVLTAVDPYDAVEVMRRTTPSAIVLDVNMPRMDGLTFLRKLMRQHPLPVLLCTDQPERGLAGLELGALDVIAKPNWSDEAPLALWSERLLEGLRLAVHVVPGTPPVTAQATTPTASARPSDPGSSLAEPKHSADVVLPRTPHSARGQVLEKIVVMGASTGGVQALARLLADLPATLPGIVIVQHMGPGGFTAAFAERLARDTKVRLKTAEARHGEMVQPGSALIIPGDVHGLVRRSGTHYRIELSEGPRVSRHRPSVDVLFRAAAQAAGPHALGVILTGMGDDGAQGMVELRQDGAWTIAQDEATSIVFGMPGAAIRRGAARQVLPLEAIGGAITAWAGGREYDAR